MQKQSREILLGKNDDSDPYSLNHLVLGGCNTNGEPRPGFEDINLPPLPKVSLTQKTAQEFLKQSNI